MSQVPKLCAADGQWCLVDIEDNATVCCVLLIEPIRTFNRPGSFSLQRSNFSEKTGFSRLHFLENNRIWIINHLLYNVLLHLSIYQFGKCPSWSLWRERSKQFEERCVFFFVCLLLLFFFFYFFTRRTRCWTGDRWTRLKPALSSWFLTKGLIVHFSIIAVNGKDLYLNDWKSSKMKGK